MDGPTRCHPAPDSGPAGRLERLWRQGSRPDLGAFLAAAGDLTPADLIDAVRVDQRHRWDAGDRVPAGDYLRAYPALGTDPEAGVEVVYAEFLLREELGEDPAVEEYERLYPPYAERLRRQVILHRAVADDPGTAPGGRTTSPGWSAGATGADPAAPPGYELLCEVGRGGMGVVYRARDLALDRDVAVKLLRDELPVGGLAARRFVDEARITAQLQHPGIPPVHAVGTLPGGRPFLAMKLIKGRTLDDLLKDRSAPNTPNLVAAFEGVCQAVGYAHAHGVVHRDLKPGNVMVGAFGEVQVMDWGLAKVLGDRPGATGPSADSADTVPGTEVRSTRDLDDETQPGSLLGTPAFMPPEQAIGAVDQVDERSDVFGLGAVLCAVLTGKPPYVADSAEAARQLAALGKLDGARGRLAGCGADPDLVALCNRCLSVEKADRPADAGEVAEAVAGLRAAADERARRAELDRVRADGERAKAEAEAREQRKRRRAQLALATAVGLLLVGGGAFAWWRDQQAADRRVERVRLEGERDRQELLARQEKVVREERARTGVEAALARLPELYRRGMWTQAADGLAAADDLLGPDGDPGLRARVAAARRDTAFIAQLDQIRLDRSAIVDNKLDFAGTVLRYAAAFREHGLDVPTGDVADLARRVSTPPVREYLLAALDDWGLTETGTESRRRIFAVTAEATGQGWRAKLTDAWDDPGRLAALYDAVPPGERSPAMIAGVGVQLQRLGADGDRRLEDGLRQYPADFWLHFTLGAVGGKEHAERKVGACRAALAVRPGTPVVLNNLGAALRDKGDLDGAVAALREAVRLDSKLARAHTNLGAALARKGDLDGAVAAHREAVRLAPQEALPYANLGAALRAKGDLDGAVAACRKAVRLDSSLAPAHTYLGAALADRGDVDGALAAHREAVRLDSRLAEAHTNLGNALFRKGDVDGALAAHREAVRLDSSLARAHFNLGVVLDRKGDLDGALAAYREAVRLDSKLAGAHTNLGIVLGRKGDLDGAVAALWEAIRLDSKHADAHMNLGVALRAKGDLDGAVAAHREAIRLDPMDAEAHLNLGVALRDQGRLADALAMLRKGHELGSKKGWLIPSADLVKGCERLVALDGRLPGVKAGTDKPASPAEAVELAHLALRPFKREYALAFRLYADAFAADPKLVPDHRGDAARAAVRLAAGDDPSAAIGWDEWYALQDRAHGWLTAVLAVGPKWAASDNPAERKAVAGALAHWLKDPDLAPVRDPARLAAMPADERKRWGAFWAEVEAVRKQAAK